MMKSVTPTGKQSSDVKNLLTRQFGHFRPKSVVHCSVDAAINSCTRAGRNGWKRGRWSSRNIIDFGNAWLIIVARLLPLASGEDRSISSLTAAICER